MLLRRVMQHVKQQDWFAVGVDFFIVVVGVFIGIQVSNWNEVRELDKRESQYLVQLAADTETMLDQAALLGARLEAAIADVIVSLNALQSCTLGSDARASFDQVLINHQGMPRLFVVRATYDEMVAGGALARIHDEELKDAVTGVFAAADRIQNTLGYFSADLGRASDIIWRKVSFSMNLDDLSQLEGVDQESVESMTQLVRYDFDTLCHDEVFRNAMIEVLDSNMDRNEVNKWFVSTLENLAVQLLEIEVEASRTGENE